MEMRMNKQTIPLGSILGISIGVDYSWFLILALITWLLAVTYYPSEFSGWSILQYWSAGLLTALFFFASVLLHELGHSLVARIFKIPVRNITLFIFGGVSQIEEEPHSASEEFWVAIAGPGVSVILAGIFLVIELVTAGSGFVTALARYLAFINIALAIFNLIPGFPLDGGRVFRAIVWGISKNMRRATLIASNVGRVIAFLFILFGVWQLFTGNFLNGLWIAFIGWFLESAASSQVQQVRIQDTLAGHKVSDAMSRSYTTVSGDTTIQNLVDLHILGTGQRSFVVKEGEELVGLVTLHHIREIDRNNWPVTRVRQAMIPLSKLKQVTPDTQLWEALGDMDHDGVNQLPVVQDQQIVGMLNRSDVIAFLRTLRELDGKNGS
jgi:Zn-dependent protease